MSWLLGRTGLSQGAHLGAVVLAGGGTDLRESRAPSESSPPLPAPGKALLLWPRWQRLVLELGTVVTDRPGAAKPASGA